MRPIDMEKRARQQAAFLEAYERTGMVRRATEAAGVNMSYHYRWLSSDEDYARRFAELEATVVADTLAHRRPHPKGYKIKGARAEEGRRKREAFLAALAKTGIVTDASAESGVSAATFYTWFRTEPEFAERAAAVLEETREIAARIKAERVGRGSKAAWEDPARREAWSAYQRGAWTPEMRAAAGERNKERLADPEYRAAWEEAARQGSRSEKGRAANSERMKRLWADPDHRARYIAAIADEDRRARLSEKAKREWAAMTPEERVQRMRSMRRVFKGGHRLTKLEAAVMVALNERDLPYFVHKPVGDYVADLLVPSLALVIEADGCFHHTQRAEGWDAERDRAVQSLGYESLRLSEEEIKSAAWSRLDAAVARLRQA